MISAEAYAPPLNKKKKYVIIYGSEDYRNAFADAEKTSKACIDAIKARATYDTEDWLIIITSDHGGINTGHGGVSMQERYMFIATNKDTSFNYELNGIVC